jgi:hypothetical protein
MQTTVMARLGHDERRESAIDLPSLFQDHIERYR